MKKNRKSYSTQHKNFLIGKNILLTDIYVAYKQIKNDLTLKIYAVKKGRCSKLLFS